MAAALNLDGISKILECAVCLGTVCNPKRLVCDHAYCKCCLDGLLQFQENGSAVIACPKGCSESTFIPHDGTTNDLGVSYMMRGILEMVQTDNKEKTCGVKSKPCELNNCKKDISFYCFNCATFTCDYCACHSFDGPLNKHDKDDIFVPVSYDADNEEIKVTCKQHSTNTSFVCTDPCKHKMICQYCMHRDHSQHSFDSFENVEKTVKEAVQQHIKKLSDLELPLKQAGINISTARDALRETLEQRKLVCLQEYLSFLNIEEQKVIESLNTTTGNEETYDKLKDSIQCYEKIASEKTVNVVLQHNILSDIEDYNFNVVKEDVPIETLSLSAHSFDASHPLGEINTETWGSTSNDNDATSSFSIKLSDTYNNKSANLGKYVGLQDKLNESFPKFKSTSEATHLSASAVKTLLKENETLLKEKDTLVKEKETLVKEKETLVKEKETMQHDLSVLKKNMSIENGIEKAFNSLQERHQIQGDHLNDKLVNQLSSKRLYTGQVTSTQAGKKRKKSIEAPLTTSDLRGLSKQQQKVVIGEHLSPLLKEVQPLSHYISLPLLLSEDNDKLLAMLQSRQMLSAEAKIALEKHQGHREKRDVLDAVKKAMVRQKKESPFDTLNRKVPLTTSQLGNLSKHQQKVLIGEHLSPILKEVAPLYDYLILPMLLRYDNEKLLLMLQNRQLLCAEAKTALKKIRAGRQKNDVLHAVKKAMVQ